MSTSANQLRNTFAKALKQNEEAAKANSTIEDIQFGIDKLHNGGWMDISIATFAQQMTLMESEIYCTVLPKECLAWNKKDKELQAPNISYVFMRYRDLLSFLFLFILFSV